VDSPCALGGCGPALANLDAEAEYIAQDNPAAGRARRAEDFARRRSAKEESSDGPDGASCGTRELVVAETPYIIPYRVRGDAVEILRVFHAARKWPEKF